MCLARKQSKTIAFGPNVLGLQDFLEVAIRANLGRFFVHPIAAVATPHEVKLPVWGLRCLLLRQPRILNDVPVLTVHSSFRWVVVTITTTMARGNDKRIKQAYLDRTVATTESL